MKPSDGTERSINGAPPTAHLRPGWATGKRSRQRKLRWRQRAGMYCPGRWLSAGLRPQGASPGVLHLPCAAAWHDSDFSTQLSLIYKRSRVVAKAMMWATSGCSTSHERARMKQLQDPDRFCCLA